MFDNLCHFETANFLKAKKQNFHNHQSLVYDAIGTLNKHFLNKAANNNFSTRNPPPPVANIPVSQIWALIVLASTRMLLVANSTPIVDFDSKLNSFRVNRDRRLDFPTPESPIRTTREQIGGHNKLMQ